MPCAESSSACRRISAWISSSVAWMGPPPLPTMSSSTCAMTSFPLSRLASSTARGIARRDPSDPSSASTIVLNMVSPLSRVLFSRVRAVPPPCPGRARRRVSGSRSTRSRGSAASGSLPPTLLAISQTTNQTNVTAAPPRDREDAATRRPAGRRSRAARPATARAPRRARRGPPSRRGLRSGRRPPRRRS